MSKEKGTIIDRKDPMAQNARAYPVNSVCIRLIALGFKIYFKIAGELVEIMRQEIVLRGRSMSIPLIRCTTPSSNKFRNQTSSELPAQFSLIRPVMSGSVEAGAVT